MINVRHFVFILFLYECQKFPYFQAGIEYKNFRLTHVFLCLTPLSPRKIEECLPRFCPFAPKKFLVSFPPFAPFLM